jgi:ribosome-associated heat shock protein Hsp15
MQGCTLVTSVAAMADSQRLDKWLWSARFYKTRGLAVEAINGGHVHVNGQRIKPAKTIRIGDIIEITKDQYLWRLEVQALAQRRGPSREAQQLYVEDVDSIQQRAAIRAEKKLLSPAPTKRPDKRQRRRIIRFINKHDQ